MKRILILTCVVLAASGVHAQYAAPGTRPAPAAAPRAAAPAQVRPAQVARAGSVELAPVCFEPMDLRDTALISTLHGNGLLCAASTRSGDLVRVRAVGGDLTVEDGPANSWHRVR